MVDEWGFYRKWKMGFEIEEENISVFYFICSCNKMIKKLKTKKSKKRSTWAKWWPLERNTKGSYHSILNKLKLKDFEHFRRYHRINTENVSVAFPLCFRNWERVSSKKYLDII